MSGATAAIDDQQFSAFLHEQTAALRAFVRRLCGNDADADDVLQESLTKVWKLRASFDPRQNGRAWLQRAAFRVFCDNRARRRQQPPSSDALQATPAPLTPCPTELRDEVRHRLAALPKLEQALLLGFHRDELSLKELAARHDLPVNTVKSHLHRARRRLDQGANP